MTHRHLCLMHGCKTAWTCTQTGMEFHTEIECANNRYSVCDPCLKGLPTGVDLDRRYNGVERTDPLHQYFTKRGHYNCRGRKLGRRG